MPEFPDDLCVYKVCPEKEAFFRTELTFKRDGMLYFAENC